MQRILAYCLLGMTALLIAHLEAQQATATLNALTLHTQAQFELLGDRIEQEELSLQSHWQNTLPAIVQQLNIDPFAASPQKLSQIARDLHVDAVSLINRDAQIVVSSLNQEGDLNFATLPSALGEQLKKNIGSGQHLKHHLDVSLKTGQLMLYHYYAPEGQNYFLQTAIALKPLLQRQQILSNHHPDAWFKVGAAAALPVH